MDPDVLVAVQELLLGAGPAVHHLRDVQLIARAVRPQDRVADVGVEGMTEDLLAEDARPRRHARDLPHAIAVEEVDRRVQIGALGAHLLEDRIDLRVEASEQVGGEHALDDHGAVLAEAGDDVFGRRARDESGDAGAHLVSSADRESVALSRRLQDRRAPKESRACAAIPRVERVRERRQWAAEIIRVLMRVAVVGVASIQWSNKRCMPRRPDSVRKNEPGSDDHNPHRCDGKAFASSR